MEVIGKIKVKGETQTFGSGFTKRELVVTTDEQYPQMIAIDFVKDNCAVLDKYSVGQDVKVSINLGGREWINPEGVAKYFNSLTGWRIEKVEGAESYPEPSKAEVIEEAVDDLPF